MSERRIASLDLLRGFAALAVAVPHFLLFQNSRNVVAESASVLAVEIFFVLSGYVLAPQIIFIVTERPSFRSLWVFWVRRWMRTIPPYLIALILTSAIFHELWTADFFRYALYIQNLAYPANHDDYFSVAWSLSVEEWFYLIFPLFFFLVAAVARSAKALVAGACFIFVISVLRDAIPDQLHWGEDVRRIVIYRMDAIAWGFMLHLAVKNTRLIARFTPVAGLAATALLGAASLSLTLLLASTKSIWIELAFPFYASAFGMAAVLTSVRSAKLVEQSRITSEAGLWLGRLSYSIYLFHLPVFFALAPFQFGGLTQFVMAIGVTIAVAALLYQAIEQPVLRSRPRF